MILGKIMKKMTGQNMISISFFRNSNILMYFYLRAMFTIQVKKKVLDLFPDSFCSAELTEKSHSTKVFKRKSEIKISLLHYACACWLKKEKKKGK